MIHNRFITVVALFCATTLALTGCAASPDNQGAGSGAQDMTVSDTASPIESTQAIPEASTDLVLGNKTDGGYAVALTNGTEQSIVGIAVCASGADDFSTNLMTQGLSFAPQQVATLYTPAIEGASSSETGIKLRATADIQITFADGSQGVIHQLSVSNLKAVTICCADGIVYADYTIGDTTESTLEFERQYVSGASTDAA